VKNIKYLVVSFVTVFLIVCGLLGVQNLTKQKTSSSRDLSYKTYFDYSEDYDVLYLGTSHVMYGINPLEIWNEYGITSYNWGSPTCTIPMSYWKLMNILDYSTPKLVVIDCFRASWIYKSYNTYRLHEAFDAFKISKTKLKAVYDIMNNQARMKDGGVYSDKDMFNILFPISAYHYRWEELSKVDFDNEYTDTKGCEFEINVADPIEISNTYEKMDITEEMQGVTYLKKIIEECQNRNIAVLLTYLPFPIDEEFKKEANSIQDIADEYGVEYINFTDINVVNYQTDYADSDSHMNVAGQKKVSEFLGDYIIKNYDIENKRDDESSIQWNDWYNDYQGYMEELLIKQDSLSNYLMMLYKTTDTVVIDLKDKTFLEDDTYYNLISNIGEGTNEISKETDFIIVKDGQVIVLNDFRENGMSAETDIGDISLYYGDDVYGLYVDNNEYYVGNVDEEVYIRIIVKNKDSIVDDASFLYSVDNGEKYKVNR
jgi:hypothetical protein